MTLSELLREPTVTREQVEAHLDGLTHIGRLAQIQALGRKEQDRLWEIAGQSMRPLDVEYLVPEDALPLEPHPFVGKNSLPAFRRFRKVFCRTSGGEVAGYNNQALERVTGPGYFVVEKTPGGPGPVMINYLRTPTERPTFWPEIRPNEVGLSRFIYCGTQDFLRYVSRHVLIGRAYRHAGGKIAPMPNWFVLCRQTP